MRITLKIIISLGALALIPVAVMQTAEQVKAYPGVSAARTDLERGLDYLMTGKNVPMDFLSALQRFKQVTDIHGATPLEIETADFLSAWCVWSDPATNNEMKQEALSRFVGDHPESPFLPHALYMQAMLQHAALSDAGSVKAIAGYQEIIQRFPESGLANLARLALAGLYREQKEDPRESARWYCELIERGSDTFLQHEIEQFRYLQAKMLQRAGDTEDARTIYHAILESEKYSAGNWRDRALDRLAELGESSTGEPEAELQPADFSMVDHTFISSEPVTLRVSSWILEKKGLNQAFTQISESYHARNPNVTVKWVSLPYTGYHDWLQTQILSDEIPDIVQIDNGTAIRYGAYQGKLVDISQYLEKANVYTGVTWAEMFWPQFLVEARDPVKRRNWVITWASENSAFIYNRDAFRKAGIIKRDRSGNPLLDNSGKAVVDEPSTWDGLITAFKKLKQAGYYGEVCNFYPDPAPLIWQMPYITKQIYDNLIPRLDVIVPDDSPDVFEIAKCLLDGTLDLKDGEVSELWRLLYEKSEYWVPGSTAMDIRDAFNDFLRGKAATIHWVSTDLPDFEEKASFELGVFPFPSLEGTPYFDGPYNETPSMRAFEFAVPRVTGSRHTLNAAMDFLMYLTSPEAQRIMVEKANTIPPVRGIHPSPRLEPFMRAIGRRGTHTTFFNPYEIGIVKEPYWAEGRTKVLDELNSLLGSIPNYAYFQNTVGGTPEVYQAWREERLEEFLNNLQKYFVWAYDRAVREYSEDLEAEIRRHQHDWIALFRATWLGSTPPQSEDALSPFNGIWRTITDEQMTVLLCHRIEGSTSGNLVSGAPPISYQSLKRIGRLLVIILTVLISLCLVVMTWQGTLEALIRDRRVLVIFIPTLLLLGIFCYYPAGSAIYHAFFKWNGADISEFLGLQNFRNLLSDGVLSGSFVIMGIFLIANILKLTPTILVAVVLFHLASKTLQYWFRVAFVLPLIIPSIVGMLVWKYFYKMDGGLLNALLLRLEVIQVPVNWLGSENTVVPSLLFIGFPFVSTIGVLILLAGLQAIPRSVFEAAQLDGCGAVRRFWMIEMPLVMGQVKLNLVLTTITTIQEFALPLILTRGGPNNASMLPGLWMYLNAFSFGKMGYASALGVVMFLIILGFTLLNMKVAKVQEE